MNIDFSKQVCQATLGEFVAAERSVGIVSGWVVALATAGVLYGAKLLYMRWQSRKIRQTINGTTSGGPHLHGVQKRPDGVLVCDHGKTLTEPCDQCLNAVDIALGIKGIKK